MVRRSDIRNRQLKEPICNNKEERESGLEVECDLKFFKPTPSDARSPERLHLDITSPKSVITDDKGLKYMSFWRVLLI